MKLVDSFGRVHNYLRISLTERCNFRCLYCMPAEGVPLQPDSHILSHDEILQLSKQFVARGVDKIRLTGGEPTVRKDFMSIVESLGALPGVNRLAITTNGLTLTRKVHDLRRYGLTGVNISLDTLVEAKFNFFTRRQGFHRVLAAVHEAVAAGIPSVKVNCVVMRGQNDDEVADFVALTRDLPVQVRFIEYMPFDGNKWQQRKMISFFEIRDRITAAGYQLNRISHVPGDTSKNYSVTDVHGRPHAGTVGFITSMTSNFCGTCNRLRITADGNLKVCLFGNEEVSLRDMLRNGAPEAEILAVVEAALHNKKREHAGMNELKDMKNRPMILIGGGSRSTSYHHQTGNYVSPPSISNPLYYNTESALSSRYSHPPLELDQPRGGRFSPLNKSMRKGAGIATPFADWKLWLGPTGTSSLARRPDWPMKAARYFSSHLTHVDGDGDAHMVDVGDKQATKRRATAVGRIEFSSGLAAEQIRASPKGDVLSVARIAGIMAVKQTPMLIPLCHPIATTKIKNKLSLSGTGVDVQCTVETVGPTGVEMEALVGATITLNTVYDMCKAVDRHMEISHVKVVEKEGGKHDFRLDDAKGCEA